MLEVFDVAVALVVVERDRPLGNIERDFAEGTVIDLPALVRFRQAIVDEGFDRVAKRSPAMPVLIRIPIDSEPSKFRLRNLDDCIIALRLYTLDLTAVAVAVEAYAHVRYAGVGKALKKGRLVDRACFGEQTIAGFGSGGYVIPIDKRNGSSGFGISHGSLLKQKRPAQGRAGREAGLRRRLRSPWMINHLLRRLGLRGNLRGCRWSTCPG